MRTLSLLTLLCSSSALAAPIRVAVESSGSNVTADELAAQLNDDTWYDFEATVVTADAVDTADELASYDVVIIGDGGHNTVDWTEEMAAALDTWVAAGDGGVVTVGWADYVTAGAWASIDTVQPFDSDAGGYTFCNGSGSSSTLTSHPVTDGVASPLSAGADYIEGSSYAPDATNAEVLGTCEAYRTVIVGEHGSGRITYLGYLYMAASGYNNTALRTGDHDRLLEQAVAWVADAVDSDGDGIVNSADNCPDVANAGQEDGDLDGFGDACDLCEGDDLTGDLDEDGYCADLDCDESDDFTYPGADELCDGLDNDCDEALDADESDLDADGYVVCTPVSWLGDPIDGGNDCDDDDASIYPGAAEICDGLLNDCDGTMPDDEKDQDADGYVECTLDGSGWDGDADVVGGDDCDGNDATVYPTAAELCDGIDNDCDGSPGADEVDADGDGYVVCDLDDGGWDGEGSIVGGGDCDDADAEGWPGSDSYDAECVPQGCGCSTSTSGVPAGLLMFGLLGGLLVRRRR